MAPPSVGCRPLGSNKALQFLNAGSIDFGSTAGSAALVAKINGNPIKSIYVYSRPEWTALVTTQGHGDRKVAGPQGQAGGDGARHRPAHLPGARAAAKAGLSDKDIARSWCSTRTAAPRSMRGDVDAWAGLDPMMAQAEVEEGARLFYRNAAANTWGILNVREEFAKKNPELVRRVLAAYEEARK